VPAPRRLAACEKCRQANPPSGAAARTDRLVIPTYRAPVVAVESRPVHFHSADIEVCQVSKKRRRAGPDLTHRFYAAVARAHDVDADAIGRTEYFGRPGRKLSSPCAS
jgi:hypothetical protein